MRWCAQQESSVGFSGCGIQRFVRLPQMGGREGVNIGEEAQNQEYDTVNLGFSPGPPTQPFHPANSGPATLLACLAQDQTNIGSNLSPPANRLVCFAIPLLYHLVGD